MKVGLALLGMVFSGISLYLILNPERTGVVPNYRFAASHWWAGESMYPGGTHGFLYVPQFALLFTPFHLVQPLVLGEILWRLLGFGLFALALSELSKCNVGTAKGSKFNPAFALLVLLCLSIRAEKWNLAATLLTIALILKPISIAPWLLAFAVFSPLRVRLIVGLMALGVVGLIHPSPTYAWSQWIEFTHKLLHSYTPENLRVSDLFGFLERLGLPNPLPFNSLTRVVAAGSALVFVFYKYWRGGSMNGSWGLWVATTLIWTIFNPRAETNSYVLISPLLAFAAVSYWTDGEGERWKGAIVDETRV